MAAPGLILQDFIDLLKPGALNEIGFTIRGALKDLTLSSFGQINPANIKDLGPLITATRNTALSSALAFRAGAPGSKNYSAEIKTVTDAYAVIPSIITGFTLPTLPPVASGATSKILASTIPAGFQLINYISKTINDLETTLLNALVQQNTGKTDAATISALQAFVLAYIAYVNGIVKAFKFAPNTLDPNYDLIIGNIEKTLTKMGVTVSTPTSISMAELNSLVQPYTVPPPPPPVAPVQPVAAAQPPPPPRPPVPPPPPAVTGTVVGTFNSDNGYDARGHFRAHFPNPNQIILMNPNNQSISVGWRITGRFVAAGAVVTNVGRSQTSSPWVNGLLVTINMPLVNPIDRQGDVFEYKFLRAPTPAEVTIINDYAKQLADNDIAYQKTVRDAATAFTTSEAKKQSDYRELKTKYDADMAAYTRSLPRATPNALLVELCSSINTSLTAIVRARGLSPLKSAKAITAVKNLPVLFGGLIDYLNTNGPFYVKAGNIGSFVTDYIKKPDFYPPPPATNTFFSSISTTNFEINLSQPTTGIIPFLVSKYIGDFPNIVLSKIVTKANSTMTSPTDTQLASSIVTKIFGFYIAFLNSIINIFQINLSKDNAIVPHAALLNKILSKARITLLTAPVALGGDRKKKSVRRKKIRRRKTNKRR